MEIKYVQEPELNFIDYSAGSEAFDHSGGFIDFDTSESRLHTPTHDKLFDAAMYAVGIPNGSRLSVIIALPYGWHDSNSKLVSERLSGKRVVVSNTKELVFTSEIQTERQGVLALVNMAFGWNRGVDEYMLNESIVHDCGGTTTETIHMKNRKDSNKSDSDRDLGQWSIAERLHLMLKDKYRLTKPLPECIEAIGKGFVYDDSLSLANGEKTIDLKTFLHFENAELTRRIIQSGKRRIRQYSGIKTKFITGGKGQELFPYFKKELPGCILSGNPLYDNALGACKTALTVAAKNTIPVGVDIGNQNTKIAAIIGSTCRCACFPSYIGDKTYGRSYN